MSQMRLRHKKPINSYVGQGTYDSNQGHDEDFAKNAMHNKKVRLMKQRPPNEQTKKYAEILCQFVTVVNQDYRNHCAQYTVSKQLPDQEQQKIEVIDNLAGNKIIKDNSYLKSQEVVSKQQQKIRKSENNINKISLTKKIRKEKILVEEQPKIKEPKDNQNKIVTTINVETKPPLPGNSKQPINPQKEKVPPIAPPANTNINPTPTQNNMPSIQQIQLQQMQQQQQLFQTQLMAMNSGLYPMYPYPMSQLVNYQMFMEQLKNNPYLNLQNMMGMFAPGMANNYIPFSKLPFTRNNGQPQQKKQDPQAPKVDNKLQNPPNAMKNEQTNLNLGHQQKTTQILNNFQTQPQTQQPIQRQQQQKAPQNPKKQNAQGVIQPIDFKKKSCYHIATAYNIHFARLKQSGLLSQATTEQGYMKLDPTFPARRIRNRKHSDSAGR